jgi:hypothetical protein
VNGEAWLGLLAPLFFCGFTIFPLLISHLFVKSSLILSSMKTLGFFDSNPTDEVPWQAAVNEQEPDERKAQLAFSER